MNKNNKSFEYTCIFGGGAIRGISYVGAVKAMEELGIKPTTIAGSSVGAIFAGLLAVGYCEKELREIFMQVNYELFRDIHFGFGKDFAISKGGIFLDWLRELIEKKFYGDNYNKDGNPPVTFADIDKKLVILTTDLTNFKCKEFSCELTPEAEIAYAIRISSSMPGLMKPVEQDGALLVDGDLQKSWPLWRLSKTLCPENERVLEFRLEGDYEGKGQNAVNFVNTVYSCVTSLATDFIMETYGCRDKFDYIKLNTGSVIVVDFSLAKDKREELMNIGYQQTIEYFNTTVIEKKKYIVKFYRDMLKHISKIRKMVDDAKYKQIKEELGLLYMDLGESKRYIDLKYYNLVDEFKNLYFENLNLSSFFGFFSVKNPKLLKVQILALEIELEERVMELESFIFKL